MKRISQAVAILPFVLVSTGMAYEVFSGMQVGEPAMDALIVQPEDKSDDKPADSHAGDDHSMHHAVGDGCGCGTSCSDTYPHPATCLWDNFCFSKRHKLFKSSCSSCAADCCADHCGCESGTCEVSEPSCNCGVADCGTADCGSCDVSDCGCCDDCGCQNPCRQPCLFNSLFRRRSAHCAPCYACGEPCGCPGGYPGCGCVRRECLVRHAPLGFFHSFDWIFDLDWWRDAHYIHHPHARCYCGYGQYAFPHGCYYGGDPHAWINGGRMPEATESDVTPAEPPADEAPVPPTDLEPGVEQSASRSNLLMNFRLFPIGGGH